MREGVSIIVVTRDNFECIARATSDIYAHTSYPYELLIVDNDSTEPDAAGYLNKIKGHDNTRVLRLAENMFYFPAVNQGLLSIDRAFRYTLVLNDDITIESDYWVQYMIAILEGDDRTAYIGDFMNIPFCPPLGGWVDGWCMFFKTELLFEIGLFDDRYIWWYAPADYAVRTLKRRYRLRDFKQPGDSHNQVTGVITHLGGQTFSKVKDDPSLPLERMFPADFRFEDLLLQHGLYHLYAVARAQRAGHETYAALWKMARSIPGARLALRQLTHALRLIRTRMRRY
jgi:glycosyltransferase involved in cell wall biosynthesis